MGTIVSQDGAENLAPTGIQSSDRPACSESLYQLSYPGLFMHMTDNNACPPTFVGAWGSVVVKALRY